MAEVMSSHCQSHAGERCRKMCSMISSKEQEKASSGKTTDRWGGAYMGFPERGDVIFNSLQ